jgi:hypothetical protein
VVQLSNGAQGDEYCAALRSGSLGAAVACAVTVPLVYGRSGGSDEFFDVVYTDGYLRALKAASLTGSPTLGSTPWRSGRKKNILLTVFLDRRQKLAMLKDFVCLMSNLPSRNWGDDIYAAFES